MRRTMRTMMNLMFNETYGNRFIKMLNKADEMSTIMNTKLNINFKTQTSTRELRHKWLIDGCKKAPHTELRSISHPKLMMGKLLFAFFKLISLISSRTQKGVKMYRSLLMVWNFPSELKLGEVYRIINDVKWETNKNIPSLTRALFSLSTFLWHKSRHPSQLISSSTVKSWRKKKRLIGKTRRKCESRLGGGKLIFHRRKRIAVRVFLLLFMYISGVIDKTFKLSADKQAMDGNELAYLDIFHCSCISQAKA